MDKISRTIRGLFITGTGTDVGKSMIAAGILRGLRARSIDAVPMKPVQTGCAPDAAVAERLHAPDLEFSLAAAGLIPSAAELELMSPFRYEPACSPHLAGRMTGRYPDLEVIAGCAQKLASAHDAIVVEGAGGLLAPLDQQRTMRDLMVRLALPVVVVARAGLGTINHTLMTLECLGAAGLTVVGVVINDPDGSAFEEGDDFIRRDNPAAIERMACVPILGIMPWLPGLHAISVDPAHPDWGAFDRDLTGWDRLLAAVRGGEQ